MAAIGILGGMGPQASAHLQHLLVTNAPKHMAIKLDTDFPEIVLFSVPVPNFIADKKHLKEAKDMLLERTRLLERAGCVVNGIACNTAHLLLPDLQATTSTPFLSIPELVAKEIKQKDFKRVGLLATPNTLRSKLYDRALTPSVEIIRPAQQVADQLEKLIFKLLRNEFVATDRAMLRAIATKFLAEQRLDAVILGCTELPLIFGDTTDPKIIDTLQILSEGLLEAFTQRKI